MQSASVIKVGDKVELKSGGPEMTVRSINGTQARCRWGTPRDLQEGLFDVQMLMPYRKRVSNAAPALSSPTVEPWPEVVLPIEVPSIPWSAPEDSGSSNGGSDFSGGGGESGGGGASGEW